MSPRSATLLVLAGEASGDAYGGALAEALKARWPEMRIRGTGGPRMAAAGVDLLAGLEDLAVMGFSEVVPRLAFLWKLERRITALLADSAVRLVVLIDYPGFNMRIARAARRRGVPVLYYVAPKVWAWRSARARALAEVTDRVAVILPFEVDFLKPYGVRATFVGHPLLDQEPGTDGDGDLFRRRWGLDAQRPLLALLPGSRRQEIDRHLRLFGEAAGMVQRAYPDVLPVVARAPNLSAAPFERECLPTVDDARRLLGHARAALIKSGTATLEAALAGTPTVVAYRTSAPTWALARRLVRVGHVALPNLVVGERIVPEHVQSQATPTRLAHDIVALLEDGAVRERQLEGLARVRASLGTSGATGRVADLAAELLETER